MVIKIEYYKGDTLLYGKVNDFVELKKRIDYIESIYDRETDNFTELLCRIYRWTKLNTDEEADYTYDRDIQRLRKNYY